MLNIFSGVNKLALEMSHSTEENATMTIRQALFQQAIVTKIVTMEFLARRPGKAKICLTARDS